MSSPILNILAPCPTQIFLIEFYFLGIVGVRKVVHGLVDHDMNHRTRIVEWRHRVIDAVEDPDALGTIGISSANIQSIV